MGVGGGGVLVVLDGQCLCLGWGNVVGTLSQSCRGVGRVTVTVRLKEPTGVFLPAILCSTTWGPPTLKGPLESSRFFPHLRQPCTQVNVAKLTNNYNVSGLVVKSRAGQSCIFKVQCQAKHETHTKCQLIAQCAREVTFGC